MSFLVLIGCDILISAIDARLTYYLEYVNLEIHARGGNGARLLIVVIVACTLLLEGDITTSIFSSAR